MMGVENTSLKIPVYLWRWFPAVKKIAYDQGVSLSEEKIQHIVLAADQYYKTQYGRCTGVNSQQQFAQSIHHVFASELSLLADTVKVMKDIFVSESYKPTKTVLPEEAKTLPSHRIGKIKVATWRYNSKSSPGKEYETALWDDGKLSCDCPGWVLHVSDEGERSCKHVKLNSHYADSFVLTKLSG
jgi:hypothetical protein